MVQVRKRDGEGGGGVEDEGVYKVLDASTYVTKPAPTYVHKNLTPTSSIGSVDSDQSSLDSTKEDLKLGRRESTDSACDTESCTNNTEDGISDEEPLVFEKEEICHDTLNATLKRSKEYAALGNSKQHKPQGQEPEATYSFGRHPSYFGKPDLNSNTKDDQGYEFQANFEPDAKARPVEVGPQESVYTSGEWIRPLGSLEVVMAIGGYYGTLNTIQALRIASTEPIKPEAVRHAVTILARRTELLQVNVGRKGLWLWFRHMTYTQVPFRVEDCKGDIMEIYYDLLGKPYDMARGPLWRVRLVPEPMTSEGLHQAVLMFTVHHCITDAFTNMFLCRETLKILNATLTGRVYVPELRTIAPAVGDALLSMSDWYHATKFAIYKTYSCTVGNYYKSVYFNGAFPQPATTSCKTRILHAEMTEDATNRLLRQCKVHGVTVHSAIMTLVQLAMVSLASERSDGQESVNKVRVFNCVNMRRYFPEEHRDDAGCFISLEEQETEIDSEDASNPEKLWSLVTNVHDNLRSSLNNGVPVRNQPGLLPCAVLIPMNYALTSRGRANLNDSHIVSTNMGNLQDLLPAQCGEGPVRITHLLRCVSDELTGHPYTIVFHTFLNRFSFSLEYYTNKMDQTLAKQFFTRVSNHISDIASFGAIKTEEVDRTGNFHKDKF